MRAHVSMCRTTASPSSHPSQLQPLKPPALCLPSPKTPPGKYPRKGQWNQGLSHIFPKKHLTYGNKTQKERQHKTSPVIKDVTSQSLKTQGNRFGVAAALQHLAGSLRQAC